MAALEVPELIVADAAAFRSWLQEHHDASEGVWLVMAKKGVTDPTSLTYAEAVDEALCHGWIDGQRRSRDDTTFSNRFTPRRPKSPWSQRNVGIVARLIAEGRMHPAGRVEIDRAQADGRWDAAYSGQANAVVPPDLEAALAADAAATAMWGVLTAANRYAIIYRLESAKQAATRARRLEQFVAMLARGETIHPQKQGPPV